MARLVPGATLTEVTLTQRADAAVGTDYDLTAAYADYPGRGSHGTVRARLSVVGDRTYLAATFFARNQSPDLHDHLLEGFRPDAVPAASAGGG